MTTSTASTRTVDCMNPVISATRNVFEMMLGCSPKRKGLMLKEEGAPRHEISAVIGITGRASGTLVLSFSKGVAIEVLRRMVGSEATELNTEVCDAVGELTNMIAGAAKAQLAHLELSISIPNIVTGPHHVVHYPTEVTPICMLFESELGEFVIEVGFATLDA
jgi:chemotaxis protein CheX